MNKIIEFEHIYSFDSKIFSEKCKENIEKIQNKGLQVEIQYSTVVHEIHSKNVMFSAIIIGRKDELTC